MSVVVLIASYIVVFGSGFWIGLKAVKKTAVRQKFAEDVAVHLIASDFDVMLAERLVEASKREPR